ncbi:neural proliferation differentiation and control protein 1a [Scophthalmus maximus]|uniref:neural proliferation differentiation and control protein 1a n=1 Tax=Scophthalmus maximus TaxID=52904 RepID=UPI001FA872A9|nr:neural proliferation differentiation and control protein 1a [Scophthalmus maximus]
MTTASVAVSRRPPGMLPLSSARSGRVRLEHRASLLPLAAVLLCVVSVSAALPAGNKCPHHIVCAKEGRHFCKPGSSRCGPCLSPLQESDEGRCVARSRPHQHVTFYPDLDEEIDFLQAVIEKQEISEFKPPQKQSKHPAAVTHPTDVKKSRADAAKQGRKSQAHPSSEKSHAAATTPGPALADTPTPQPRSTEGVVRAGPLPVPAPKNDKILVILISVCVTVGTLALILATVCFVKMQKKSHLAQKVDYPAFAGASMPAATAEGTSVGDQTLAQNAQMFHYQHQKQQMLSLGSHKPEPKVLDNEVTSDEEEVGGDFTVYECPGLAPTGEMEVKNPLFDDSSTHYQGNQM